MNAPCHGEPWSGLALALSADRAVLGPEGAALVVSLIGSVERSAWRDGVGLSPQMTRLRAVLEPVARERHRDVANGPALRLWDPDEVSVQEAVHMLNRSPRQVQRLAGAGTFGPVRRVGRGYLIPRAEVAAYATRTATDATGRD